MINIRDAMDSLERAKSSAENIERYAHDCDFGEARLVILELIAEIERLQDLIDKPTEEADWVADYHILQSALDGPIIDDARKWHDAYRKAQNSNLMRTKEVKRLRSLNESLMENGNDLRTRCQKAEARIKELEADRIEARAQYLLFMNDNPGCIAWNFDELDETEQDALREKARYMLELEEPWVYVQLREAREQIKRLEAAFLRSNAAMRYYQEGNRGPWPQLGEKFKEPYWEKAREALEQIKAGGGKDE